jgi:hypothetical protein
MKTFTISGGLLALLILAVPARGQHHMSNWVLRTATDTTIVQCRNDSLTVTAFPPNSMNMMMMPDSIYCRIDRMDMDSLRFPHDSTFVGWYRVQAGSDSMHFNMMNGDSMYGGHNMLQFMKNLSCQFHWDSLMADSSHRHWHPTGMKGWNGSGWVSLGGTMTGNTMFLASSQIYSAFAFIGTSSGVVSVTKGQVIPGECRLEQNYPNPFNPSTSIKYELPKSSEVRLSVYDMLGREVSVLVNETKEPGNYTATWDANGMASGMYFYRMQAGDFIQTKRLVHLK